MVNGMETAALVIEHTVKRTEEKRYEEWLAEVLKAVSRFPGYLGREVFPPSVEGKPYTTIVRFETEQDSNNWLGSSERRRFIEQVQHIIEDGDRTTIKAGIDVWFTPANAVNKPPAYKQFLLTWAAIFPLSLIVPLVLSPAFGAFPALANRYVSGLIVTGIITALMTYLVMPNLTKRLHNWLFAAPRATPAAATRTQTERTNL